MNALGAAYTVLNEVGQPLHYSDITKRVLEKGLWATQGKTPWSTVNAQLAVDIKEKGVASRFIRTGPGWYAVNMSSPVAPLLDGHPEKAEYLNGGVGNVGLSFTDAAERILIESGSREPLHYRTITDRALEQRLIQSEGRTPSTTMYSGVLTENRRRESRGETPRFLRHGRGLIGLVSWLPIGIAARIEDNNREVKQSLLDRARQASPEAFESLVAELLTEMGFEDVKTTTPTSDGGIDVRGTLVVGEVVRIQMAIQAKRWAQGKNVQAPIIQQVRGSLGAHEQGLVITTSDFSRGAREEAVRADAAPVSLMNGEQLASLLANYEVGARAERYDLLTLNDIGVTQE